MSAHTINPRDSMTATAIAALRIAVRFGNDGRIWLDADGVNLAAIVREAGSLVYGDRNSDAQVWRLADGSAIALTSGGWDVVVPYRGGWATRDESGNADPSAWTFGVEQELPADAGGTS